MRSAPAPDVAPTLPADAAAWLRAHGAADVRVGADGVIEFSTRPLRVAWTCAARDLLPSTGIHAGAGAFGSVVPVK